MVVEVLLDAQAGFDGVVDGVEHSIFASGIMPLGIQYTISHLASLTDMPVEWAIAAAIGIEHQRTQQTRRAIEGVVKRNRHASGRAAVHGVQYVCAQSHGVCRFAMNAVVYG